MIVRACQNVESQVKLIGSGADEATKAELAAQAFTYQVLVCFVSADQTIFNLSMCVYACLLLVCLSAFAFAFLRLGPGFCRFTIFLSLSSPPAFNFLLSRHGAVSMWHGRMR